MSNDEKKPQWLEPGDYLGIPLCKRRRMPGDPSIAEVLGSLVVSFPGLEESEGEGEDKSDSS